MTKKDEFINYIEKLMASPIAEEMSDSVKNYWEAFKGNKGNKPTFTDGGKAILECLRGLPEDGPMLKAKDIAETMGISSRSVSGSIRKLVTDGFVEKVGQDPVMYSLTDAGRNITIE